MVTAGPTVENIDPVRFISNYSTGKMGFSIALEAANRGAKVILVSGKVNLKINHKNIKLVNVVSADQMLSSCLEHYSGCDYAIFTAAVADYKVENISDTKIKRSTESAIIQLIPNKDISLELGKLKTKSQINIGFALETNNEEANALKKISKKNLDFIVLNSLNDKNAGFGFDTNKITIFNKSGSKKVYPLKSKKEVASDILNVIDK